MIRRATVDQIDALGRLGLVYADMGTTPRNPSPPFLGGVNGGTPMGFFVGLRAGDEVLVGYDERRPYGSFSTSITPDAVPQLAPGESRQQHPDGRIADYLKNDGTTMLYDDGATSIYIGAAGAISIVSAGRVDITAAGGVYGNGIRLDVVDVD